ncbi:hypothetical protein [Alkalimarinus alittae]|uniref:Uncharacterized protein n=1 Tax=Alkalimarinus alittae TaxID=2961619 RepID=A0ABY6MXU9_9ALTE|nr:hypothetical protein [Alkalimarinus alittae]UZE94630.1 hypothetical protein NKI27_11085 [Alkalimarinus alittae]
MNTTVKNSTLILSLSMFIMGCSESSDEYTPEDTLDAIEESKLIDEASTMDPSDVIDTDSDETPLITSCFQSTNGGSWGVSNMCTESVYYNIIPDKDERRLACEIQGEMENHTMTYSESRCPTEGEIDRCLRNVYEDSALQSSYAIVMYPPVDEHYLKAGEGLCTSKGPEFVYSKPSSK